jgi:hypothetical protein
LAFWETNSEEEDNNVFIDWNGENNNGKSTFWMFFKSRLLLINLNQLKFDFLKDGFL